MAPGNRLQATPNSLPRSHFGRVATRGLGRRIFRTSEMLSGCKIGAIVFPVTTAVCLE
jgi:hypothetical protein